MKSPRGASTHLFTISEAVLNSLAAIVVFETHKNINHWCRCFTKNITRAADSCMFITGGTRIH
ncbi:hypothetical protein TcasGA2_TC033601 [Tribolium castaneum]|uniref:Uncharacterized protein n=1 Tax=Tribolium castaneum TaxID=7070 RepID=A0A139WFB2_TRICA|nr:hypothetical protein TcasGA2_TC033601 [Tribolium castaneum]